MSTAVNFLIEAEGLPDDYREMVDSHWRPLSEDIAEQWTGKPLIVGINGAQGSGKTTLCKFLEALMLEHNQRAITLSLDDLYLTHAERQKLAREMHPLFATRGVPGTHDVALGNAILDALSEGRPATLPRFDKAADDRFPQGRQIDQKFDVILFEGWCVGAAPQLDEALREPINRLEAEEDPDGTWRHEVNRRLATDYAELFGRIDLLVMLKVEGFEAVRANRKLQEEKLARTNPGGAALMDDTALDRFLMHYERLTRWTLEEMPARAGIVVPIGPDQRPV